jgi:hypothetical protein
MADVIITFPNTQTALKAEALARIDGFPVRMIPVPRNISANCNMGMQIPAEDRAEIEALFSAEKIKCDYTPLKE